jgi:hypothetical protein
LILDLCGSGDSEEEGEGEGESSIDLLEIEEVEAVF